MPNIRLDGMLSGFVPKKHLDSTATSVEALLDDLEGRYPRLKHRLRDETRTVRRFVRIYVNGEEIRVLDGVQTRLAAQDSVEILHSIQGG
jgi:sulfur-carrier protein